MLKILMLADKFHANTLNFVEALGNTKLVELELVTFDFTKKEKSRRFYKFKRALSFFTIFYRTNKAIKRFDPDIILGYRTTSYGFIATRFSKKAKIVITMQGVSDIFPWEHWTSPIKKRLQRSAFNRASLIQAWGMTQQQYALLNGADPNKMFVLPRGINLNQFKLNNERQRNQINWIVSRSLSDDYNHELLINSFATFISSDFRTHHLYIAGEGILEKKLKLLVQNLNLGGNITFLGRISNIELSQQLYNAHIYISLPVTEGVSASLLEAMACGCIPIVSDLPSNREWINNGVNGVLTKIDKIESVVESFNRLFSTLEKFETKLFSNRQVVELKGDQNKNTLEFINEYQKLVN